MKGITNPRRTWQAVGKSHVRSIHAYDMLWNNLDVSCHFVAVAPNGGPIAVAPDSYRIGVEHCSNFNMGEILIYTQAGISIGTTVDVIPGAKIHSMVWTEDEVLCVVYEEGYVRFYALSGEPAASDVNIDGRVEFSAQFASGVVLTTESCIFAVEVPPRAGVGNQLPQCRVREVAFPRSFTRLPETIAAVSPAVSASQNLEVLVAPSIDEEDEAVAGKLFLATFGPEPTLVPLQGDIGKVILMSVSPSGQFVAVFTEDKELKTMTYDFRSYGSCHKMQCKETPVQVCWCADKFLILAFGYDDLAEQEWRDDDNNDSSGIAADEEYVNCVLVLDPEAPSSLTRIDMPDNSFYCFEDRDCVRLITRSVNSVVQPVPSATKEVFSRSTKNPAALLMVAYEQYREDSALAVKTIQELLSGRNDLDVAVEQCIDAATHEFNVQLQQQLLRVASYGKSYLEGFDSEIFVQATRRLRVLNAIRKEDIGIPMTIVEFTMMETPEMLIHRLIMRDQHMLAYHVSKYLGLSTDPVVLHWGKKKMQSSEGDEAVCEAISEKLRDGSGATFGQVAAAAIPAGRVKLARLLVQQEKNLAMRVPLQLHIGDYEPALISAIKSGNGDLIFMVITHLVTVDKSMLFILAAKYSEARALLTTACRQCPSQRELLGEFYIQAGEANEAADLTYHKFFEIERDLFLNHITRPMLQTWNPLQTTKAACARAAERYHQMAQGDDWKAQAANSTALLLEDQRTFSTESKDLGFLNSSAVHTIRLCFKHDMVKQAEMIKTRHGVDDKKYAYAKLRGLCDGKNWDAVLKMGGVGKYASTKIRSPIGFHPFFSELLAHQMEDHAALFISKVSDPDERMEMYVESENYPQAVDDCEKTGDIEMLAKLRHRTHDRRVIDMIDKSMERLHARGK